jgi:hypothetical protein
MSSVGGHSTVVVQTHHGESTCYRLSLICLAISHGVPPDLCDAVKPIPELNAEHAERVHSCRCIRPRP